MLQEIEAGDRGRYGSVEKALTGLDQDARKKLGFEVQDETPADDLDRSVDREASSDIDAMMPSEDRGVMHQPVETATRTEPRFTHEANLARERKDSMNQEMSEGLQRYHDAFLTAVDRLLLRPRSDTVKDRWDELTKQNREELIKLDSDVRSGAETDPIIIRAKFDLATERLTRFAEDADKPA